MYVEVQKCIAVIRDAIALQTGDALPAAAAALMASRLPERLRVLSAALDFRDAPQDLAQALQSGDAAGCDAHRWLPPALTWLQKVVARC